MWPLTDTGLHLIQEANLISARRHGVDLHLDAIWPAPDGIGDPSGRAALQAADERLLAVLVHAWPNPADPVVVALRDEAECLRDLLALRLGASAAPWREPQHQEFGAVEDGNRSEEIPGRHHQEAVQQVRLAFVQGEP